jgi:hypothetical protein
MTPVKTVWIFKDKKSSKKTAPNTRAQNPPKNKKTKTIAKGNFKHKKRNANKNKNQPNNNYPTLQTTITVSSTSANQPKQEQTHHV